MQKAILNLIFTGIGLCTLSALPHDAQAMREVSVATSQKTVGGLRGTNKVTDYGRVVYSAMLIKSGRYHILFKMVRSGDHDNGTITAKFACTDHHNHVKVFFKEVSAVLGDKYFAEIGNYIGIERRQVFVQAGVRATETYILDCDGTKVRTLYENCTFFLPTVLRAHKGKWLVEESTRQSEIGLCEGTFYLTADSWQYQPPAEATVNTLVGRLLKWNGRVFTPMEPGKSHIVVTSYAHYLRSHGIPVPHRYSHAALPDYLKSESEESGPSIPNLSIPDLPPPFAEQ